MNIFSFACLMDRLVRLDRAGQDWCYYFCCIALRMAAF